MDMDEANADLYDDSVLPMGVAAAAEEEEEATGKNDSSNISSNGRGSRGAVGATSEREWDDAELRDGDDGASALLDPSATLLASFRICLHARSPPDFYRDPTQARGAAAAPARLPHLIAVQWYTLQSVHHPETDPDRLTLRLLTTGKTPQLKAERTLDIRAAKMVIKKTTEVDPISIDQIAIIEKFRWKCLLFLLSPQLFQISRHRCLLLLVSSAWTKRSIWTSAPSVPPSSRSSTTATTTATATSRSTNSCSN